MKSREPEEAERKEYAQIVVPNGSVRLYPEWEVVCEGLEVTTIRKRIRND